MKSCLKVIKKIVANAAVGILAYRAVFTNEVQAH